MGHFRVRIKRGDFEVEVDSSEKEYTEAKIAELLEGSAQAQKVMPSVANLEGGNAPESTKPVSLAEHIRALSPRSGPQYVVAVGDYLERYGGMQGGFKTRDIIDGFQRVKYKHSNPAEAVRQAKQQGFLMDGRESGTLLVTQSGEAWVRAQLASD